MNKEENDTEAELAAWELLREARLELAAVTEQRDRLAEAIRKHKASFPFAPDFCDVELYEALQSLTTNEL
jgi:hypothetical protein